MVVLYDGSCGFCKVMLAVLLRWDRARRLDSAAIQSTLGQQLLEDMPADDRLRSWHFLDDAGELRSGGPALPVVFAALPRGGPVAGLASRFPGATARAYAWVAEHRVFLGRFLGARPRAWSTRVIAERERPGQRRTSRLSPPSDSRR